MKVTFSKTQGGPAKVWTHSLGLFYSLVVKIELKKACLFVCISYSLFLKLIALHVPLSMLFLLEFDS